MSESKERPVLVSTAKNFLVFGWTMDPDDAPIIRLKRSRLIVYWSQDVRGLWGLAAAGATQGCKISAPCDCLLRSPDMILEVTLDAAHSIEQAPWT